MKWDISSELRRVGEFAFGFKLHARPLLHISQQVDVTAYLPIRISKRNNAMKRKKAIKKSGLRKRRPTGLNIEKMYKRAIFRGSYSVRGQLQMGIIKLEEN